VLTVAIVGGGFLTLIIVSFGCWQLVLRVRYAEKSLVASARELRSTIENATHGIYRADAQGRFLAVNSALVRMLGYGSAEELMAVPLADLDAGPRRGAAAERAEGSVVVDWKRKDGAPIVVRLSGRPLHEAETDGAHLPMLVEDVTERRQLEEQLRQAQKMEAVGQLTGGIAHDLNNLLTAVAANADLLAPRVKAFPDAQGNLDDLRDATRRASQMIEKLLAFSRRQVLALQPIDLSHVLHEIVQVLRRVLPEHIDLAMTVADRLPSIEADEGAIEQILVNLATNARDAMPGGGALRISLEPAALTEEFCAARGWGKRGDYVRLSVVDTGVGMSDEVRRRLFEPFFTTKPPGSGTGLGMAMIYGLTKQHDGFVDIESRPGEGTTVSLYFPCAVRAAPAARAVEREEPAELPVGNGESVLVVEDNVSVLRAVVRQLQSLDYDVVTACDGADALRVLEQRSAGVDLVITDVVMPKMSGPELRGRLREMGLETPVIYMSGYPRGDRGVPERDPDVPYLHKPWTAHEFAATVRGALDLAASSLRADRRTV
jgi:PAS domain S-box-containing protein